MDIKTIAQRLNISDEKVIARANEYYRQSKLRFPAMGVAEVCRSATCLHIACQVLDVPIEDFSVVRFSGAPEKVYKPALISMQKALEVKSRVTAKALCNQYGCVRLEESVKRTLASYRERFVDKVMTQGTVADFSRPVFVAVAFFLVAKKNKVKVDRRKLEAECAIGAQEFGTVHNSMYDLCFDTVGIGKKPKPEDVKRNGELLDRRKDRPAANDESDSESSGSDDRGGEEAGSSRRDDSGGGAASKRRRVEPPGAGGGGGGAPKSGKLKGKRRGYDEWKEGVLASRPLKAPKDDATLRQMTLSFGRGPGAEAEAEGSEDEDWGPKGGAAAGGRTTNPRPAAGKVTGR